MAMFWVSVMVDSVSDEIQDDFIAQDVQLARVDAGLRTRIDARLDALGRKLKALTLDVDVAGTQRRDAQIRRLGRLNVESRELIRQAYSDINAMTRKVYANVAEAESMSFIESLEQNVP